MKNFIKENWLKILIIATVFIIAEGGVLLAKDFLSAAIFKSVIPEPQSYQPIIHVEKPEILNQSTTTETVKTEAPAEKKSEQKVSRPTIEKQSATENQNMELERQKLELAQQQLQAQLQAQEAERNRIEQNKTLLNGCLNTAQEEYNSEYQRLKNLKEQCSIILTMGGSALVNVEMYNSCVNKLLPQKYILDQKLQSARNECYLKYPQN